MLALGMGCAQGPDCHGFVQHPETVLQRLQISLSSLSLSLLGWDQRSTQTPKFKDIHKKEVPDGGFRNVTNKNREEKKHGN
eukprot:2237112-Amphidinium_carterae.1